MSLFRFIASEATPPFRQKVYRGQQGTFRLRFTDIIKHFNVNKGLRWTRYLLRLTCSILSAFRLRMITGVPKAEWTRSTLNISNQMSAASVPLLLVCVYDLRRAMVWDKYTEIVEIPSHSNRSSASVQSSLQPMSKISLSPCPESGRPKAKRWIVESVWVGSSYDRLASHTQ
jgi:hypothetical protein